MGAEVVSQNDWFSWSLNQLSREFGIARETVGRRLSDAGISPSGQRRGHPVYRVGEAARAILVPQQQPFSGVADPDSLTPKERRDWYASENDRVKLEKESGIVAPVEEVRVEWGAILQRIGAALDVIPDKLERKVGLPADGLDLVEREIDSVRNDLADTLEQDVLPEMTADLFED